jgi:hypothetical protein
MGIDLPLSVPYAHDHQLGLTLAPLATILAPHDFSTRDLEHPTPGLSPC